MKAKSVGAIIKDSQGRILMLDRVNIPLGWASPAGHVDEGETPEQAFIREAKEETNLDILEYKFLFNEFYTFNICRKGHVGHDFYVYEATKWSGEIKKADQEASSLKWVEIGDLSKLKLEPVWEHIFTKLKII